MKQPEMVKLLVTKSMAKLTDPQAYIHFQRGQVIEVDARDWDGHTLTVIHGHGVWTKLNGFKEIDNVWTYSRVD